VCSTRQVFVALDALSSGYRNCASVGPVKPSNDFSARSEQVGEEARRQGKDSHDCEKTKNERADLSSGELWAAAATRCHGQNHTERKSDPPRGNNTPR
jgi:hypothetical protein